MSKDASDDAIKENKIEMSEEEDAFSSGHSKLGLNMYPYQYVGWQWLELTRRVTKI